jgi:hypothetical protein
MSGQERLYVVNVRPNRVVDGKDKYKIVGEYSILIIS